MDHINFVNRIDELLIEQGINRAKLLRETELAESTIRSWRRGVIPNVEAVYKIALFLNTSVEYLLTGNNKDVVFVAEETQPYNDDTPLEDKLLNYFRKLNEKDKKLLYSICCLLSSSEV